MHLLSSLPALLLCRFELSRAARFRFFRAPTVYGFLHARLGTKPSQPFPFGVRLLAVESARTRCAAGDAYHIAPWSRICPSG